MYRIGLVILFALILVPILGACGPGPAASTPEVENTATSALQGGQSTLPVRNTLRIAEPMPGTEVREAVTVKGEGMAFENTILVKVTDQQGNILGEEIVTTTAETGEVGEFTVTLQLESVKVAQEGKVTIYTTSAKDGTVDQEAWVRVKLVP